MQFETEEIVHGFIMRQAASFPTRKHLGPRVNRGQSHITIIKKGKERKKCPSLPDTKEVTLVEHCDYRIESKGAMTNAPVYIPVPVDQDLRGIRPIEMLTSGKNLNHHPVRSLRDSGTSTAE